MAVHGELFLQADLCLLKIYKTTFATRLFLGSLGEGVAKGQFYRYSDIYSLLPVKEAGYVFFLDL